MAANDVTVVFAAETTQFTASVKRADEAIGASARTMEAASQRLEKAWNRELLAQERLEQKTQQAARTKELAALKADILARSEIQASEAAVRSEISYTKLIQTLQGAGSMTDKLATSNARLAASQELVAVSGEHQVSSMAASSGAIRLLEGNFQNNIRAAERFIGTTLGLGPVLEAAFPIVGAVALLGVVVKMGKEAYDTTMNFVHLKSAIEGLNELQITVDKKVGSAADSIEEKVESILEKTQGKTVSIQQKYNYQSAKPVDLSDYFYDDKFKKLPDDVKANYETAYKSIAPQDLPDRLEKIRSEVTQLTDAVEFSKSAGFGMVTKQVNGFGPAAGRDSVDYYTARLTAAKQIKAELESQSDLRTTNLQDIQVEGADAQKTAAEKKAREAEEAARKLEAAQRRAAEASYRSMEQIRIAEEQQGKLGAQADLDYWSAKSKAFTEGSTEYLAIQRRIQEDQKSLGRTDAEYRTEQAHGAENQAKNAGSLELANIQLDLASHRIDKLTADQRAGAVQTEEYTRKLQALRAELEALNADKTVAPEDKKVKSLGIQNQINDLSGQQQTGAVQAAVKATEAKNEDARTALRDADAVSELADMNRKNADSLEQLVLAHQVSTGAISKHDQAVALAAEHAAGYSARLAELADQQKRIEGSTGLDDDQKKAALDKNSRERIQIEAEADRTSKTDQWAEQQQTAVGGFLSALQEMAAAGKDYAAMTKSLTTDLMSGVNKTLMEELTTRNHQGQHLWRQMGHDFATQVTGKTLQSSESSLLGFIPWITGGHNGAGAGADGTGTPLARSESFNIGRIGKLQAKLPCGLSLPAMA